jgi:hypothetical protein
MADDGERDDVDDESEPPKRLMINCAVHGRSVMAIVCRHMVGFSWRKVGFIQNTDHADDLQAWCDKCERMFLAEGDRTERFEKFHGMTGVCTGCWETIKKKHAR